MPSRPLNFSPSSLLPYVLTVLTLFSLPVFSSPLRGETPQVSLAELRQTREWTDVDGREMVARFIRLEGDSLRLVRDADQQEFLIPLERFSSADRQLVQTYRESRPTQTLTSGAQGASQTEWPMWRWDSQAGTTVDQQPLQNPTIDATTHLWVSEADIPPGRRGSQDDGRGRDGLDDMERPLTGGFGSPIAAAGKVFHYFYRPTGTVYDRVRADTLGMSQEELQAQRPELEGNLVRGHERWLVGASDMLVAIDQETGQTVWQTELTDQGLNFGFFGKGAGGMTPVYHQGMVMTYGTSAQVFGVDAATGELRWTFQLHPRYQRHRNYLQSALGGREMAVRFNRDMLAALVAADGLVIINDQQWHNAQRAGGTTYHYDIFNSYIALDVQTGEVRWEVPEVGASGSNPKLVEIDGRTYVLAVHIFHLTLIDLETGEIVWQSDHGHHSPTCAFNLGVSNDYVIMAARAEGSQDRSLKGYRLTLNGLEELWSWGRIREYRSNILIRGETAYLHINGHLRAFAAATGETIAEVYLGDIRPAGGNPFIASYGGWLFTRGRGVGEAGEDGIFVLRPEPDQMADTLRFFPVDTSQPYFVLTFPAFANQKIFFRTDHTSKIEAYQLD